VTRSTEWLSKSIYILAASLYFLAVALRTWLFFQDEPVLGKALALLLLWVLLFASESVIFHRWAAYFPLYLIIQTALVFVLMALPDSPDFMGTLLGVLSMQVMLRLPTWVGGLWIAGCAVFMVVLLQGEYKTQAIALTLIYTAGNVFLGSYMRTIRQAQAAHLHNQELAGELKQANQRLQEYSAQTEQLATAGERNRLARELHDSVTQTAFSMNLTTQSAALLLKRDPSRVEKQLERLYALSRSALSEMQVLINQLKPEPGGQEGLLAALRRLLTDSRFTGSLSVSIEVEGEGALQASEEQSLFRIAQEALNNILKHAHTSQAHIRLHLEEPFWMEIEDHGQGFDLQQAQHSGRVGLASMSERASEIGWTLQVISSPGTGTRVRAEREIGVEKPQTTGR
jgi:signal transduction histidine kinase